MLKITAYGRLASNIEMKIKDNIHYTNFLLATHEQKNKTTFIRCVGFGPIADLLEKHCAKGDRIIIYGDLIPDKYINKSKQKEIDTFKIKVDTFDFVETQAESLKNKMKNSQKKGEK